MSYLISGLDPKQFAHLREASSEALAAQHIERMTVDGPGFPDRVTLVDLTPGESVLLLNYEHQPANTPYRSSHAIFVSENATEAAHYRNTIPQAMRDRMLSVRAFDEAGMMVDAALVDGKELEPVIERMFEDARIVYLHAHYAQRGCFAARVDRGD